ncbi:MAG: response regulator [Anaerolineae bacterium]|nr:response regulator [Anaerolineae bacterium]
MSIGIAGYFSLATNATLATFSAALALLIVLEDSRRRSNLYFSLAMTMFALHGMFNTVWPVAQQFNLDAKALLYSSATVYIAAVVLLFNFLLAFAGVPHPLRRIEHLTTVPAALIGIGLVWGDAIFDNLEPLSSGAYRYEITPIGSIGIGVILVYLGSSIYYLIFRHRHPKTHELAVPVVFLTLGIASFAIKPSLSQYAINAAGITIAVVFLGRSVLTRHVFQPLIDLNQELIAKNIELDEATRMKSQFLANMSHELRTPLNSIIGYTNLVLNRTYGNLSALQVDRLEKVVHNGYLLLDLINDVLDLSKIEAGHLALNPEAIDITTMLNELLESFSSQAQSKGLAINRDYANLPVLWADRARTYQIAWNLISNAIKFTDEGSVTVRGNHDAGRRQIILSVIDTGIGIPPEKQEHVFKAFQETTESPTRRHEGTGLGLTLARHLVEMHNGHIWFESTPGMGSSFHVALPAAAVSAAARAEFKPGPNARGRVVLVIDDDTDAIETIQEYLENASFQVYGASSAKDGLRLAREISPSLITLNVVMPHADGMQVLAQLREDNQLRSIPVLIVSVITDHQKLSDSGAAGFITKPINEQQLIDSVRRLVNTAPPHQESAP